MKPTVKVGEVRVSKRLSASERLSFMELVTRCSKWSLYSRYVVARLQHAEIGNMIIFDWVGSTDL
jgi:hypothetical protein